MPKGAARLSVVAILLMFPHFFTYGDPLKDNLLDCREIVVDAERLSCLDEAIAVLKVSGHNGNETNKNHQKPLNTVSPLGEKYIQKKNSTTKKEHVFNLLKAYKNRKKHWVFELDNGQHWQQNEARYLPSPTEYPVKVVISQGTFGAYNLTAQYLNKTVKVKRIH